MPDSSSGLKPSSVHPRLYRRFFTSTECGRLDSLSDEDGSSEVEMLRVVLARAVSLARTPRPSGWTHHGALLSVFSHAALNLAALVRLQVAAARNAPDPLWDSFAARDVEDL